MDFSTKENPFVSKNRGSIINFLNLIFLATVVLQFVWYNTKKVICYRCEIILKYKYLVALSNTYKEPILRLEGAIAEALNEL